MWAVLRPVNRWVTVAFVTAGKVPTLKSLPTTPRDRTLSKGQFGFITMSGNKPKTTTASPPNQAIKRLRMLDPDGDSTMHSSLELARDDDVFSGQQARKAEPSTPRNPASFALGASSELSPPNSQGPSNPARSDGSVAGASGSPSLNVNGKRILTATSANTPGASIHTDPETGYQWSKREEQPGFEWKNARAREEELRALDAIADKAFMIKSMSLRRVCV
jgi:hypothetical protein